MMPLILANKIVKHFGEITAVEDLSLHVERGEIYGLVGPDGAGKTTTARLLCGALGTHSGEISIAGYDMASQPYQARAQIGYLPQRFSLYKELTAMENLRFFSEVRGLPPEKWKPRSLEILRFVGLEDFLTRSAGHLSGGMRQKLGLAVALIHQPSVLLLDEPTTGVDPVMRQDFWQLVLRLAAQKEAAVLVTTPYMDEASRCDRIGFLRQGSLLIEGAPNELRSRLQGRVLLLVGEPLRKLRRIALEEQAVEDALMFGDRIHLRIKPGMGAELIGKLHNRIANAGGRVTALRLIPPQLEDVFIALLEPEAEFAVSPETKR